MIKVFFDTNIMIDVIGRREQFCKPSMQIMRNIDYIITRNKKDFEVSEIPVFEPQEFVDYLLNKDNKIEVKP
jgi:hypothetical protein